MVKRFVLAGLMMLLATTLSAQETPDCKIVDHCVQDQFLRIDMEDLKIRDSYANISLSYTNLDPEAVDLTIYSIYLIATSAAGERIELSTNRRHIFIGADATRREAFSLKFNNTIGDELDVIFIFENPDGRYAFLGLRPEDFTNKPELF